SDPAESADDENRGPSVRESVSERGEASGEIADDADGFAQRGAIGDPAAGEFGETREAVRDAFDDAERVGGRADSREECREDAGRMAVAASWPQSEKRLARPMPRTPRVSQRFEGGDEFAALV